MATIYLNVVGAAEGKAELTTINDLRTWFLIFAFVSIGLEFRAASLREAGWRPIGVFAAATVVNLVAGLALASWLFADFAVASG